MNEKQKNCPYCHPAEGFESFGLWQRYDFVSYMWFEGWKALVTDGEVVKPEEMMHGRPDGSSMMIWRKDRQKSSAILYHMDPNYQGEYAGIAGSLLGVNYCPKCGRKIVDANWGVTK